MARDFVYALSDEAEAGIQYELDRARSKGQPLAAGLSPSASVDDYLTNLLNKTVKPTEAAQRTRSLQELAGKLAQMSPEDRASVLADITAKAAKNAQAQSAEIG